MNILSVHNYYKLPGGEDLVFKNEAAMLKKHGHNVFTYTRDNKELDAMNAPRKVGALFNSACSAKVRTEISDIIRKKNIDIIHVHNTHMLITPAVYYAACDNGIPVVQTMHNFRFFCIGALLFKDGHICRKCMKNGLSHGVKNKCYHDSFLQSFFCKHILEKNRKRGIYKKISYICLTEFNKKLLIKGMGGHIDASRIFVKPNFIPDESASVKPSEITGRFFLYAGRLDDAKGIYELVKYWPSDVTLCICGSGPLKNDIENEIKNKDIHLAGQKSHDEILSLMKSAEALVFPSLWYETFGMVIAESYMCGTPVIANDIGNGCDMVKKVTPELVFHLEKNMPEADAASLKEKLKELTSGDLKEEYSSKCRTFYLDNFTEEKNYELLMDIYKKCLISAPLSRIRPL